MFKKLFISSFCFLHLLTQIAFAFEFNPITLNPSAVFPVQSVVLPQLPVIAPSQILPEVVPRRFAPWMNDFTNLRSLRSVSLEIISEIEERSSTGALLADY